MKPPSGVEVRNGRTSTSAPSTCPHSRETTITVLISLGGASKEQAFFGGVGGRNMKMRMKMGIEEVIKLYGKEF